jgi:hypothetical protein
MGALAVLPGSLSTEVAISASVTAQEITRAMEVSHTAGSAPRPSRRGTIRLVTTSTRPVCQAAANACHSMICSDVDTGCRTATAM